MNRERLAYGVEPSSHRYRLRLARYPALAEAVGDFIRRSDAEGNRRTYRLCDVGVGNGRSYRYLEHGGLVERLQFTGIDNSPKRLDHVYGGDHWSLLNGDVEQGLPFADASFDIVVCEQVLEHLHHPDRALADMARVLRPGGCLIAGVPVFPPGLAFLRRRVVPSLQRLVGSKSDHVQAFSLGSFLKLIRRTPGLEIERYRGFRIFSGGPLRFLENYRWWYRWNRFLGRAVPSLCTETQVIVRKRAHQIIEIGHPDQQQRAAA